MESFITYGLEHFPEITLFFGLLALALYVQARIIKFRNRVANSERINNESFTSQANTLKELDVIKTTMVTIAAKVNEVIGILANKKVMIVEGLKVNSPIQLSELGNAVLIKYGGKQYIENNLDLLLTYFQSLTIKSRLDVQTGAVAVLKLQTDTDAFTFIKECLYENPIYKGEVEEIFLDLDKYILFMSIYLRDAYLTAHPFL